MKKIMIATLFIVYGLNGISQLSVSGEIRPRTEYDHGAKKLATANQDAVIFTSQRTRLNFNFNNDYLSSRITLQDIRVWGSQPQLNIADGLTSVHEAWVKVKFSDKFALKTGRQEIVYDDQRIFGNVGWAQQGRSHDAVLIQFSDKNIFSADLGIAYNQNSTPGIPFTVTSTYKAMQYLWVHKVIKEKFGISVLILNNGNQLVTKIDSVTNDYSIIYSQTAGTRLNYQINSNYKISATVYYQTGKDATNKDLNAYYAGFDAGASLMDKKFNANAGIEILSGTDQNTTANQNNSFTPFYGTNHKFNGHMDYFYVGNHFNSVGLQDIYLQLSYKLGKWVPAVDFHNFSSAAQIFDKLNNKSYPSNLGNELDFYINFKMNDFVTFSGGYSQMFATSSLEFLRGGNASATSNWAWLMLNVSPEFFNTKK